MEKIKKEIIITTVDLKINYDVIGPVYFKVSNKGFFSSQLEDLVKVYKKELELLKQQNQLGEPRTDRGFLYGELSVGQDNFDKAFYVAVQELKKRAIILGADAIVGMKQDIDLDTTYFQYFYLQMYGTAVKFK